MSYLYELWEDFISLLLPRLCHACGDHLLRNEHLICTQCFISIPRTNYHLTRGNPVEQLFWGRCLINRAAAFSYYSRGSRIRRLIHRLKYDGIKEIGFELGKIYGLALKNSELMNDIDLIIPVPLHKSRQRSRGFNQSECIAGGIAEVTGCRMETKTLVRIRSSDTQTKRSRYERWMNVEGIFMVTDPQKIDGKHILLVDDVITTGSTLDACASELLKTENVKVSIAALAVSVR
jgi:ComF family protein